MTSDDFDSTDEPQGSEDAYKTAATGYFESPKQKACGTCSYYAQPGTCSNPEVLSDPDVPAAKNASLKAVNGQTGLCNEWSDPDWKAAQEQPDALKASISASRPFGGGYSK